MKQGKKICSELKQVRRQIAESNGIKLNIPECTYEGDCKGTCPRCEAEVRYLERELEKRMRLGKVAVVAGVALGLAACSGSPQQEYYSDGDDWTEGVILTGEDISDTDEFPDNDPYWKEKDSIIKSKFISYDGQVFGGDPNESLVDEY